jgi:parallel beta-helix repeat protein
MKHLLHFRRPEFLSKKVACLLVFAFTTAILFISCKNDFSPTCKDGIHGKSKNAATIVHRGGSIQAAVDAAQPGDIIHIEAGIYKEAILVNKPGIQLIGLVCNPSEKVIIQNPADEEDGITVRDNGDGFVLKNVTIENFEENGVFMIHADNFLLSHVETIDDGEYGLFPLFCNNGIIEYCSATGHDDTGIYVGQSSNLLLQYNVAFGNVNGLEIENCTNVEAIKNHSYDNVSGILVVLLPGLTVKSSSDILVTENIIEGNNHVNFADPEGGFEALVPSGSGILVVGVDRVEIKNNKISNNNFTGIATVSTVILGGLGGIPPEAFADIEPNPDGTKITNNILDDNGSAPPAALPLPGVDLLWDGSGTNNCWKNNTYSTSYPAPLPQCS